MIPLALLCTAVAAIALRPRPTITQLQDQLREAELHAGFFHRVMHRPCQPRVLLETAAYEYNKALRRIESLSRKIANLQTNQLDKDREQA